MSSPVFPFRRRWSLNDTVAHVAANRRGTAFAVALDGGFVLMATDDAGQDPLPVPSGQGRCLCFEPDADEHAFLAGSADGCLSIVEPGVAIPTVLAHYLGEAVSCVASSPHGYRACACGAALHRFTCEGQEIGTPLLFSASVQALAFSPDGLTLAVAYEKGVALVSAADDNVSLQPLPEANAPLSMVWSADGRALFALDGAGLAGWRWEAEAGPGPQALPTIPLPSILKERAALRFSADGGTLFVQGLDQPLGWSVPALCRGEGGAKAPLCLADQGPGRVTALSPHPQDPMAAIGYEDGTVLLSPYDGRRELVLFPPSGIPAVGLIWDKSGTCLHLVLGRGEIFLFTLSSVRQFQRGV